MLKISVKKSETSRFNLERLAIRQERGREIGMPKRIGHLYEKFSDREWVKWVLTEACKYRNGRKDVEVVKNDLDNKTEELCRMLETGTFIPHEARSRLMFDSSCQKHRTISTVPFYPDCCVQWLIVEAMKQPVFMRGMDAYCSASIPGRGGIHVYKKIKEHMAKKYKQSKYALQMDVRHYYDNVSIPILMKKLERRCKDRKMLDLIHSIISASASDKVNQKGLAIGLYLNQWLANFFLEDVDRAVRESGLAPCFVRYMDNLTVIGSSKRKLRKLKELVERNLKEIQLELKGDWQIFRTKDRDIRAVGYRFFANGSVMLRKRNWLKMRRQFIRVERDLREKKTTPLIRARSTLSRIGNLVHLSTPRVIQEKYVNGKIDRGLLKRIIAEYEGRSIGNACIIVHYSEGGGTGGTAILCKR